MSRRPSSLPSETAREARAFPYAWRLLNDRRALWAPSLICALTAALPASALALFFATSGVAFLLTGDVLLASSLLPGAAGGTEPLIWLGVGAALAGGILVWNRFYPAAVWLSDSRNTGGFAEAMTATRVTWRKVLVLYLLTYAVVLGTLVLMGLAIGVGAPNNPTAIFGAAGLLLVWRTILRIALTLAIRSAVLGEASPRRAWSEGVTALRTRKSEIVPVWIGLLSAGVALWIGGRLVSPVLQETALSYRAGSPYMYWREVAQLLFSVPLASFLLVLSLGTWTALWLGDEAPLPEPKPAPRPGEPRRSDPRLRRFLIAVLLLAVVGNGIPTLVDDAHTAERQELLADLREEEILPVDVVGPRPSVPVETPNAAAYSVDARLEDDTLTWTTSVDYLNATGERLPDVGFNVYPAAYSRSVPEIPLGAELLAADVVGNFGPRLEPGTFEVMEVSVEGDAADYEIDDTALTVRLDDPLLDGDRLSIEISLTAQLPVFPERFGRWEDMVLLGNWIPTAAVRQDGDWRQDTFGPVGDPFFSEAATYTVRLDTEERMRVVGTGTLTSADTRDGRTEWVFEADGARDAAYAVGPFLRGLEGTAGNTSVRFWYQDIDPGLVRPSLRDSVSAVTQLTAAYGTLPFDEVEVVHTNGILGGMEYPGVVFVSSGAGALEGYPLLPDLMAYAGYDEATLRYVIGHEIAHQWWYASVGNDQVNEPWLDEALAEATTRMWLESREGDDRTRRMAILRPEVELAGRHRGVVDATVHDYSSNASYTAAVYLAGSQILMEVRDEVGPGRFDEILASWHRDTSPGIGTIDEFVATLRRLGGDVAADFIESYRN